MRHLFEPAPVQVGLLDLPEDLTGAFPRDPLTWLKKYGITDQEITRNNIQWSPSKKRLYFPIYDDEEGVNLVAHESRNFSGEGPKTIWKGADKDSVLHILGDLSSPTLVVVEDILSAIKVGRQYACLPLFGSNLSDHLLWRLRRFLGDKPDLTLWLDADKLGYAMKAAMRAAAMGFTTRIVSTQEDPKAQLDRHIKELVMDSLNDKTGEYNGKV